MKYYLEYEFWGDSRKLSYTDQEEFDRELERVTDDPNIVNHTIKTYTK